MSRRVAKNDDILNNQAAEDRAKSNTQPQTIHHSCKIPFTAMIEKLQNLQNCIRVWLKIHFGESNGAVFEKLGVPRQSLGT